ncbi:MAG TPA: pirin family protein, partial [Alcaligenaceae bacterium]|nr:pirin family protein [Alcaligenaceae bacterium]
MSRTIEQLIPGQATSDGAGVKLTRLLSHHLQRRLDPFLMLDAFGSDDPDDYIAGFPDHPHRGFETVTYMLKGRMLHRDSQGNEGLLEDGGMQWMSAARGVIHSEIPQQKDGIMAGFQLWINLPAAHKMDDPWYKDITPDDIPSTHTSTGAEIRLLAGQSHGITGAIERPNTEPLIVDVTLNADGLFQQAIPQDHNAFVVLYEGNAMIKGQTLSPNQLAILANDGDQVEIQSQTGAKFLVVAGKPLNEPIVQYGPFVMNSEQEIHQAINDYNA